MRQHGLRAGRGAARLRARPPAPVTMGAAVVGLLAAGAGIITAATVVTARGYLMRQADRQLRAYADRLVSQPFTATPLSRLAPGTSAAAAPGGGDSGSEAFSIEVRGTGDRLVLSEGPRTAPRRQAPSGSAFAADPAKIPVGAGQVATIPAAGGGSWLVITEPVHYRARRILFAYGAEDFSLRITSPARPGAAGTLVVGLDLAAIGQAIGRLAGTCLAVSGAVILAVAGLGAVMIRVIARRTVRRAGSAAAEAAAAARGCAERMSQSIADTGRGLRRPLSIIRGCAESCRLRGPVGAAEAGRMMARVGEEAARMSGLVDDHLSLAEPRTGPGARPGTPSAHIGDQGPGEPVIQRAATSGPAEAGAIPR